MANLINIRLLLVPILIAFDPINAVGQIFRLSPVSQYLLLLKNSMVKGVMKIPWPLLHLFSVFSNKQQYIFYNKSI